MEIDENLREKRRFQRLVIQRSTEGSGNREQGIGNRDTLIEIPWRCIVSQKSSGSIHGTPGQVDSRSPLSGLTLAQDDRGWVLFRSRAKGQEPKAKN